MKFSIASGLSIAALLAGAAGTAQADDIKLRIASGHPTANTYVQPDAGLLRARR